MQLAREVLQEIPGQIIEFFTKRRIFPKPAKEEERNRIQAQLSLKSKMDPSKKMDLYQLERQNKLIDKCSEMGMDTFAVQDII